MGRHLRVRPGLLILEPYKREEITKGGIILGEGIAKDSSRVIVEQIHPDTSVEYGVKAGDEVIINQHAIYQVDIGMGEMKLAANASDIMVLVEYVPDEQPKGAKRRAKANKTSA